MTPEQRQAWIAERRNYIGGSDVAAIIGQHPYRSRITVWREKTGQVEPPNITDLTDEDEFSEPAYWGVADEDNVARRFTEETGLSVKRKNIPLQHKEYAFLRGNIDREGRDAEGKRFVLECKTTTEFNRKEWELDKIPVFYELQVLFYLILGNYDYGWIACRIGNSNFVKKRIERDHEMEEFIVGACVRFWNEFVATYTEPPTDPTKDCKQALAEMHPPNAGSYQAIDDPEYDRTVEAYFEADAKKKEYEKQADGYKNALRQMQGDIETLSSKTYKTTCKMQRRENFDISKYKEEHPDATCEYIKVNEFEVFTPRKISQKGGK